MTVCSRCQKLLILCVCDIIRVQETHTQILILQHPQEPDHLIGSALLTHLALANSTLKVGLSWRNLSAVIANVDPARWIVLYLGSGVKGEKSHELLQFVSKQGIPVEKPEVIDGVIVLDGTWSQAKTLWWRNPWLLKLRRAILTPQRRSLYKELRKEPRRECLSTIESVAELLDALGESKAVSEHLREIFLALLHKYRAMKVAKERS